MTARTKTQYSASHLVVFEIWSGYLKIVTHISFESRHLNSIDSNEIRPHNHLVRKRTLNHLAKLAWIIELFCEYLSVRCICLMLLSCYLNVSEWIYTFWPVWLNGWVFVYKLSGCGFECRCSHFRDIASVLCKGFLNIQATIECRFTLKRVRDMIITYNLHSAGPRILILSNSVTSSFRWVLWISEELFLKLN